jgi:hypothetical protein
LRLASHLLWNANSSTGISVRPCYIPTEAGVAQALSRGEHLDVVHGHRPSKSAAARADRDGGGAGHAREHGGVDPLWTSPNGW